MTTDNVLQIRLNGQPHRVSAGLSVAEMLAELSVDPKKVAVERNLEIVPRTSLGNLRVQDGDEFEIVHFVGGG